MTVSSKKKDNDAAVWLQKSCPLSKKPKITVTTNLIKYHQFSLKLDSHLAIIEEKINSIIENRSFNKVSKSWNIDITYYPLIIDSLRDLAQTEKINLHFVNEIWKPVVDLLSQNFVNNKKQSSQDIASVRRQIHPSLRTRLFSYQLTGVAFIKTRNGCCLLADQIGLGKRVQAIASADAFKGDWPVLIICHELLKNLWFSLLQEWLPEFSKYKILITDSNTSVGDVDNSIQIVISSYEAAFTLEANLLKNKYEVVIVDECHNLEKYSDIFYSIKRLIQKSIRRLLLTSAPPYLEPAETYRLLNIIDPKTFPKDFIKEFNKRYHRFPKLYQLPIHHVKEYKRFLYGSNVLARGRDLVQKDLPTKQRDLIPLSFEAEAEEMKLLEKHYKAVIKNLSSDSKTLNSVIQEWFDLSQQIKLRKVISYLSTFVKMKHYKIIIFVNSYHFADEIENLLISQTVKYVKIDPRGSEFDRLKSSLLFDRDDNIKAAIISLKFQALEKIALRNVNAVLFCELDWNVEKLRKAENIMFGVEEDVMMKVYYQYLYLITNNNHLDHFLIDIINKHFRIKPQSILENQYEKITSKQEVVKEKLIDYLKHWTDHNCEVSYRSNHEWDLDYDKKQSLSKYQTVDNENSSESEVNVNFDAKSKSKIATKKEKRNPVNEPNKSKSSQANVASKRMKPNENQNHESSVEKKSKVSLSLTKKPFKPEWNKVELRSQAKRKRLRIKTNFESDD